MPAFAAASMGSKSAALQRGEFTIEFKIKELFSTQKRRPYQHDECAGQVGAGPPSLNANNSKLEASAPLSAAERQRRNRSPVRQIPV